MLHVRACSLRHSKPCHASAQTLQAAHSRQPTRTRRGGLARRDTWYPGRLGKHIVHDADNEVLHRKQRRLMHTGGDAPPCSIHAFLASSLNKSVARMVHPDTRRREENRDACDSSMLPAFRGAAAMCQKTRTNRRAPPVPHGEPHQGTPPLIWDLWHPAHPPPQSNRSGSACCELTPVAHGYSRRSSRFRHVRCDPGRPGSAAIVICADVITKQPTVHP